MRTKKQYNMEMEGFNINSTHKVIDEKKKENTLKLSKTCLTTIEIFGLEMKKNIMRQRC